MPVHNRIAGLAPQMTEWRQDLHAHPELAFGEHRTSGKVAGLLQEWGIEVTRGIAGTGLVGTLRVGSGGRSIGLRADMDALPMQEATGLAYQSATPGRMHACGHDGHTAMLLGAAHYLAETRNFDGTVHFIFQPAEEDGGGAGVMVREGLFERFPCDMVFGAHNDPSAPLGTMAVLTGPVCANTDDFWVRIHGRGGHAAHPEATVDPVVIGAHIVLGLQLLVSRRTDPMDPAVLSISQFHAGSAPNIIPDEAALNGTVRTLQPGTRREMERMLREVVAHTARAHGAKATVEYEPGYPGVVNAPGPAECAARAAIRLLGEDYVTLKLPPSMGGEDHVTLKMPPSMGGEDFAYMALAVPGCFVRIGMADGPRGSTALHNTSYDFNDDALPIGASFWAALIEQEMPRA